MTLEKAARLLAVLTAAFYVSTFLIELSFFWDIGPEAIAAFSLSEHLLHATTVTVPLVVTLAVLYAILSSLYALLNRSKKEYSGYIPELNWLDRSIIFLISALLLAGAAAPGMGSPELNPYRIEFAVIGFLLALFGCNPNSKNPELIALVPIVLSVVMLPAAVGYWEFRKYQAEAPFSSVQLDHRRGYARIMFIGNDKILWLSHGQYYLGQMTGHNAIQLSGRRHMSILP